MMLSVNVWFVKLKAWYSGANGWCNHRGTNNKWAGKDRTTQPNGRWKADMSNSSRKSSEKKILCWPSANCSTRPGSNSILVSFCSGCLCHNYEIYGRNTFGREMFCKSARRTNPLVGETRSHIRLWFRWLVGRETLLESTCQTRFGSWAFQKLKSANIQRKRKVSKTKTKMVGSYMAKHNMQAVTAKPIVQIM